MTSKQGHFLVASPYLPDPNFMRSVVLIVSHDDEHAFGLVLNRPGRQSVQSIWTQVASTPCEDQQAVRVGGPLEGPLMVVHTVGKFADAEVVPDVYLATQRQHVAALITQNLQPLITVNGYSGWGAGQLDRELEVGGWMAIRATRELVFADAESLWKKAAKLIGDDIMASIELRHVPEDPRWN